MAALTPKSVIQLTAFAAFETDRKLNSVYCILLLVPLQIYIWQKKNWALLTELLKVKTICFCQTIATHKNVNIVQITTHERSLDVSRGNLNMAMARYRYTSERIAKR